ncbi:MAG: hypothetical protein HZB62_02475 [Nitrospirae bacterium]|nr:hypothetical protein [Nitrospirota bacterium]
MKAKRMIMVAVMAAFCIALLAGFSLAEEKLSIKGKIKDYDLEAKTLVIRTDDGKEMTFVIKNEKALIKLDDRLFKDDEVKIRYSVRDGKNVIDGANDLKGTKPGC